jgi:hypothetical protein
VERVQAVIWFPRERYLSVFLYESSRLLTLDTVVTKAYYILTWSYHFQTILIWTQIPFNGLKPKEPLPK